MNLFIVLKKEELFMNGLAKRKLKNNDQHANKYYEGV